MPELPEIETVKLQLRKVLTDKKILKVEVLKSKSFIGDPKSIEGKKVIGIDRRAKLLLLDLEGKADLAIHFKMTGQLIFVPKTNKYNAKNKISNQRIVGGHPTIDFIGELPSKHTRVIFYFDDGILFFNDQRIFGWVRVIAKSEVANFKFIKDLGPEPFAITADEFVGKIKTIKKPVKLALMDQGIISGVGNIYANDALWESGINPKTPAFKLSVKKLRCLYQDLIKVLNEGIKYGGATAANYVDLHGLGGHYQDYFRVYDRDGQPCLKCQSLILKIKLGGRGTYYCPKCQK